MVTRSPRAAANTLLRIIKLPPVRAGPLGQTPATRHAPPTRERCSGVLAIYVALPWLRQVPRRQHPGEHDVAACCPAACGHCGGRGCEERAGGREACCALDIQKARRSCNGTAPPCVPHGRVGIGEVPTNHSCTPLQRPRTALIPSASMRDAATKILIVSSPKAGATLAERIMLARLNLTGVAAAYRGKRNSSGYPLLYAHEVFQKQRSAGRYPDANHLADCADPSWLCIALVRTPLDRAVSSYVHSLKYFATSAHGRACPRTSLPTLRSTSAAAAAATRGMTATSCRRAARRPTCSPCPSRC